MKTTASTFRSALCFLTLLPLSVVLAACGSGGGTSSNPSGTASVNVSLAAAPGFPEGTVFTASPAAVEVTAKPVSPVFDNVFVNIVKVALLPADGGEGPDPNGETMGPDDGRDRGNGFVTAIVDPPGKIDLLDLPSGRKIARFLDKFVNVPAGTYGKIRIYYSDLWGVRGTEVIPFHPTANSHFDVHFVNGNLVIPVAPDPERGIRLYDVTILSSVSRSSRTRTRSSCARRCLPKWRTSFTAFREERKTWEPASSISFRRIPGVFRSMSPTMEPRCGPSGTLTRDGM